MNGGKIEQAGAPRNIFNKPNTEFVARFLGGHNVVEYEGQKFSVRADLMRITKGDGYIDCEVTSVEYFGDHVSVGLIDNKGHEYTSKMSEEDYFSDQVQVGNRVAIRWQKEDTNLLEAA